MQLPAFLQNSTRAIAAQALAGLSQGSPAHISIRQNRFRLVDSGGQEKLVETFHIDVVIADANPHISHVFYKDAFDPASTDYKPPACYSDNGVGPSEAALDPQSATCASCPHSAWGSATSNVTGKDTKACNDSKKLACLVPGLAPGLAFMLRVPPASLKNLAAYVAGLNGQVTGGRRVDVTDVITRLSFDAKTQGVLNFQAVNWIDEEIFNLLEEKGPNPYPQLTGANDVPRVAALPAPKVEAPAAVVAPPVQEFAQAPAPQPGFGVGSASGGFAPNPAAAGFTTSAPESAKRRRRTNAEMEADAAAKAVPQGFGAPAPKAEFGIVQDAPAPDTQLSAAISEAFNLKM